MGGWDSEALGVLSILGRQPGGILAVPGQGPGLPPRGALQGHLVPIWHLWGRSLWPLCQALGGEGEGGQALALFHLGWRLRRALGVGEDAESGA